MATIQELRELALHAVRGTVPTNFTAGSVDIDAAFADSLKPYCSSMTEFMKNRYDLYDIIIKAAEEVVPNKVIDAVGIFAEVQTVPRGQKAIFKRRLGKTRARKFLTQVGLSGVYETFRMDNSSFELGGHAIGGGVSVDFDRLQDGAESLTEYMNEMVSAQTDAVYNEVQKALRAAINATARPAVNKISTPNFDPAEMLKLVSIVRAYGSSAVIFAPPEFVAAMGPDAIVPVGTNYQGIYHPQDIDAIHNQGYINIFRGTPIVQLPQSFVDEKNEKTWIDPQLAYVFPAGQEKVVKIVFEGETEMWDWTNKDRSMEIMMQRKIGVAILTHHNWCIYQNTGIEQTLDTDLSEYL